MKPIVPLMIWVATLMGILVIYIVIKPNPGPDVFPWEFLLVPLAGSTILRWLVLPKPNTSYQQLAVMLVGIAFAEGAAFMGIFLTPNHRLEVVALSAAVIAQYCPFLWLKSE